MASPLSCDQCEALLSGYLLHALEAEETTAVAAHLSACDRCPASLEAYTAVLDRLAQAVPQLDPPADLRQRLRLAAEASLTPLAPEAHAMPGAEPLTAGWRAWRAPWALVVTAASVLCALGMAWWAWQTRQAATRDRQDAVITRHQWQQAQQELERQRQAFALITAPGTRPVLLKSDAAESQARGMLILRPNESEGTLVVQDLPPLRGDRVYQLWLVVGDQQRDNGGTFQVDTQGFGVVRINAPRPLTTYRRFGITEEPAGGSPGPTTKRVIGGSP